MPAKRRPLVRLACAPGLASSRMLEPRIRIQEGGAIALGVDCAWCVAVGAIPVVHYVGRTSGGAPCWQTTPYAFASLEDAEATRDLFASLDPANED